MARLTAIIYMLMVLTTSAVAVEREEIGKIRANFGGETIAQPTVLAQRNGKASPTAFLILPGAGISSLNLAGYSPDNKRLGLEVT